MLNLTYLQMGEREREAGGKEREEKGERQYDEANG